MFKLTKLKTKRIISFLLVTFALVMIFMPSFATTKTTEASFGFCKSLGAGMSPLGGGAGSRNIVASDAKNRKWTVQELFSGSTDFTAYAGETGKKNGQGKFLLYDTTKDTNRGKGVTGFAEAKDKLSASRNLWNCSLNGIGTLVPDMWVNLAGVVIDWVNGIVSQLFNPNFICPDPTNPTNGCINLLATIGGTSNDAHQGIISDLYTSVYQPLIVLAFLCTAMWLMYKGLIKREMRASISGLLWALGLFIVGGIAMLNPTTLAGAPQKINSTIGSCIVGAMNGQSCLDGSITAPSTLVGEECRSDGDTSGNEGAEMAVNGMGCSLWKSFVMNNWAEAQFGRQYNDLYLKTPPSGTNGTVWSGADNADVSKMGVHLQSSQSADDFAGGQVTLDGGTPIYNLALYQLYLRSGIIDSKNTSSAGSDDYDNRWYYIAVPATKDSRTWAAWAGGAGESFHRGTTAFMALLLALMTGVSLCIFAFWGLVYSFAGTLLMAFAPLFFLVAVVPGRGKKIFLGWLESVVSSTLKYMASALFVIVALAMYAGILNNTSNQSSAFIGIVIMVGTMFTYRKEIINLLGRADFGGQQISNAVGEKIKDRAHAAKELGAIAAGSAVGAKVGGDTFRQGVKSGVRRRLQRDNSFVGGVVRQHYISKNKIDKQKKEQDKLADQMKKKGHGSDKDPDNGNNPTNPKGSTSGKEEFDGPNPPVGPGSLHNRSEGTEDQSLDSGDPTPTLDEHGNPIVGSGDSGDTSKPVEKDEVTGDDGDDGTPIQDGGQPEGTGNGETVDTIAAANNNNNNDGDSDTVDGDKPDPKPKKKFKLARNVVPLSTQHNGTSKPVNDPPQPSDSQPEDIDGEVAESQHTGNDQTNQQVKKPKPKPKHKRNTLPPVKEVVGNDNSGHETTNITEPETDTEDKDDTGEQESVKKSAEEKTSRDVTPNSRQPRKPAYKYKGGNIHAKPIPEQKEQPDDVADHHDTHSTGKSGNQGTFPSLDELDQYEGSDESNDDPDNGE